MPRRDGLLGFVQTTSRLDDTKLPPLSPWARHLEHVLPNLAPDAAVALKEAVSSVSVGKRLKQSVLQSLATLDENVVSKSGKQLEHHLARAVDRALRIPSDDDYKKKKPPQQPVSRNTSLSGYRLFFDEFSRRPSQGRSHLLGGYTKLVSQAWKELSLEQKRVYKQRAEAQEAKASHGSRPTAAAAPPTTEASTTSHTARPAAAVSDSEDGAAVAVQEQDDMSPLVITDFWAHLLEALSLQVVMRTSSSGHKKSKYYVHSLAGPVMFGSKTTQELARCIQREFGAVYDGCDNVHHDAAGRDCRVYSARKLEKDQKQLLWIQFHVGRSLAQMHQSDSKKIPKTDTSRLIALVSSDCSLVVLTASKAVETRCALSALEASLTCSLVGTHNHLNNVKGHPRSRRVGDLKGTDPIDLLKQARDLLAKKAVGRFARYAAVEQVTNPIADLQTAATASLLSQTTRTDQKRLHVDAQHSSPSAKVGQASLVVTNTSGTRTLVNHSTAEALGRKRSREEQLGNDAPVRTSVQWDWKGETTAAAASLLDLNQNLQDDSSNNLPRHTFKCRVVMQGSDVFQGMRALMDAGLMEGPLPDYVKDAPGMDGTIHVDHGAIVSKAKKRKG